MWPTIWTRIHTKIRHFVPRSVGCVLPSFRSFLYSHRRRPSAAGPVFMRVADVSGTGSGGDGWQASKSPSANCQPLSCALLLLLMRIFRPSLLLLQLRLKVPIVAVVKRRQMMNECKFAAVRCLLIWNWKAKHVIIKVFLF